MKSYRKGGRVRFLAFETPQDEAEWISQEIQDAIKKGARAKDFAVLVRSAFRVDYIVKALENLDLPVSRWLGARYDVAARKAIETCLAVARGKLSDRQAARLCQFLRVSDDGERVTSRLLSSISIPAVESLRSLSHIAWKGARPTELLAEVRACMEQLEPSLISGFDQIAQSIAAIQSHDADYDLESLLAELALGGVPGSPTEGSGVKVSTIHRAKGLQWPSVYLVGLEEEVLPDYRAKSDAKRLEETRACFVGICRAELDLTVTATATWGRWRRAPSRFLRQLGLL